MIRFIKNLLLKLPLSAKGGFVRSLAHRPYSNEAIQTVTA